MISGISCTLGSKVHQASFAGLMLKPKVSEDKAVVAGRFH